MRDAARILSIAFERLRKCDPVYGKNSAIFSAGADSNLSPDVESYMYITKKITITVHATADDWRPYDLPGREDAAIALNQRFEELVNKGAMRSEVRNGMRLSDYANLGAAGAEVRYFVEVLLEKTFGDKQ